MSEFATTTAPVKKERRWPGRAGLAALSALTLATGGCVTINKGPDGSGGGATEASAPDTHGETSQQRRSMAPTVGASVLAHPIIVEASDNHAGVPVFSDNRGAPLKRGEPSRIPYGTTVNVVCYAPNEAGMASVTKFYKIVNGVWHGDYAPSDSFDNGAGMGPNDAYLDSRVEPCAPQEVVPAPAA